MMKQDNKNPSDIGLFWWGLGPYPPYFLFRQLKRLYK